MQVFASQTENTTTDAIQYLGGPGLLSVIGVFDGATVALEVCIGGDGWQPLADDTIIVGNGSAVSFTIPSCSLRVVVSGKGSATNLAVCLSGRARWTP